MIVGTEEGLLGNGYGFAKVEDWRLQFRPESPLAPRIRVGFESTDATQIGFLLRLVAALGADYAPFGGAMLWVTDSFTGPDGPRAIALAGIESQRRSFTENRPLEVAPVHYFDPHEFELSLSMLVLAVVGGLNGYYYPSWSLPNYFLRFSGGTYVEINSYDDALIA